MIVQWIAPESPSYRFIRPGVPDPCFASTGGWSWDEAVWVGCRMGDGHRLRLTALPNPVTGPSDVVVLSPEYTAMHVLNAGLAMPPSTKVIVRAVASPPPDPSHPAPVWDDLVPHLSRIAAFVAVSEQDADAIWNWVVYHTSEALRGRFVVPLGAVMITPPPTPGHPDRQGVVYLGSTAHAKRVPNVIAAAGKAGVSLTLCLAGSMEGLPQVGQAMGKSRVEIRSVGAIERRELLSRVRAVVTATDTDNQWLPGREAQGCGALAIAPSGGHLEEQNGDRLLYHDGTVEGLAKTITRVCTDDEFFARESQRQYDLFVEQGLDADTIGIALWHTIREVAAQ